MVRSAEQSNQNLLLHVPKRPYAWEGKKLPVVSIELNGTDTSNAQKATCPANAIFSTLLCVLKSILAQFVDETIRFVCWSIAKGSDMKHNTNFESTIIAVTADFPCAADK